MSWTSLCALDELVEGRGKYVEIDGFQIAVFLQESQVYAIDNNCPHAGGNLAAGSIERGCVVCPLHAWAFRLENGQLRDSPGVAVTSYRVRLHERSHQSPLVQVDLPIY